MSVMSMFGRFFNTAEDLFEYGGFLAANKVLYGLLAAFNKNCEEKGLYRDRNGNPLTMQMKYVENFHDLRDIFKLELDSVDFENNYSKLTALQKERIINFMVNELYELSKTMKTTSTVTTDDCELEDISVVESGISISYKIENYGKDSERYIVSGYRFPDFQRADFLKIAKNVKDQMQMMVDQNEVHAATKGMG